MWMWCWYNISLSSPLSNRATPVSCGGQFISDLLLISRLCITSHQTHSLLPTKEYREVKTNCCGSTMPSTSPVSDYAPCLTNHILCFLFQQKKEWQTHSCKRKQKTWNQHQKYMFSSVCVPQNRTEKKNDVLVVEGRALQIAPSCHPKLENME